mgnify:CR=1 FL=1
MKKQAFVLTLGVVLLAVIGSMGLLLVCKDLRKQAGSAEEKLKQVTTIFPDPTPTRTSQSFWSMEKV